MYFGKKYQNNPQAEPSADDRRAMRRRHLIFYLRVWDVNSGEMLGHIVDLNTEGLMLISEKPIEVGKIFELEMRWQNSEGEAEQIRFDAQSRWSNNDVNDDFYDTGFQLIAPSETVLAPIQTVISQYGFADD